MKKLLAVIASSAAVTLFAVSTPAQAQLLSANIGNVGVGVGGGYSGYDYYSSPGYSYNTYPSYNYSSYTYPTSSYYQNYSYPSSYSTYGYSSPSYGYYSSPSYYSYPSYGYSGSSVGVNIGF